MMHTAETWAVNTLNLLRCNVKANDEVCSDSFLSKLGTWDLDVVLCTSRMMWVGHVEHRTGWIAKVRKTNCSDTEETGQVKENMG